MVAPPFPESSSGSERHIQPVGFPCQTEGRWERGNNKTNSAFVTGIGNVKIAKLDDIHANENVYAAGRIDVTDPYVFA
jgi:hypothetical protein